MEADNNFWRELKKINPILPSSNTELLKDRLSKATLMLHEKECSE